MKKNGSKSKKNEKMKKAGEQTRSETKKRSQAKTESESGDISSLILRDHEPIKELLSLLKDPDVPFSEKLAAFDEFMPMLTAHAKAEEQSLYVQLKEVSHLRVEGYEGDVEHALAEQLMEEISDSEGDEDIWMSKVKVLAELVDHHIKEEEKEVLKAVRKEFNADERMEIGEMYSWLLSKYKDGKNDQKEYEREDLRAEYV